MKSSKMKWKLKNLPYRRVLTTNNVVYWYKLRKGKKPLMIVNYTQFMALEKRWAEEYKEPPEKGHLGGIYG